MWKRPGEATRYAMLLSLGFAIACDGTPNAQLPADGGMVATDSGLEAPDGGAVSPDSGADPDDGGADPDDAGETSDSGDSGDSGEARDGSTETDGGAPPPGACTNAADQTIHDTTDVPAGVETCASGCFGGAPCTRECIIMDVGLSMDCAECYVEATRCAIQNCLGECAGSDSAACEACRDENGCTEAFFTCSGFTPDS